MNGTTGIGLDWSGLIGLLIIAGIFGYGNGFGFGGGNGAAVATLTNADLTMGLYNQTTDNAIRGISSQVATLNDNVLIGKYDNALLMKDASQQLSNSIASIGNLVVQENQNTRNMIMQNKIDALSDTITILRGENSNLRQNQYLLSQLAITAPKPPCYYSCAGETTTTTTTF